MPTRITGKALSSARPVGRARPHQPSPSPPVRAAVQAVRGGGAGWWCQAVPGGGAAGRGAVVAGAGAGRWCWMAPRRAHTEITWENSAPTGGSGVPGRVGTRRFGASSVTEMQSRGGEQMLRCLLRRIKQAPWRRARSVSYGRQAKHARGTRRVLTTPSARHVIPFAVSWTTHLSVVTP